ncbi:MAG: putative metal-binding motif-containing protein [Sandaracinaceae bacterium]|nr:putative metal-binding motif-containing protein [Sandaracinaceae bacterium]
MAPILALLGLGACGARTGLEAAVTSSTPDAGAPRDAGRDAGAPCGPPAPETCNRVDDDCDGRVDEELGFGELRRVVVRDTQGTTGACSSCFWAAGPQVWLHDDGMLALWRMGFDGSRPMPNAWARRLDLDGTPRGEPFVLFDTRVPNGFRLAPIDGGRAALGFCGRFGGDDVMTSAFVGPDGEVLVAPARRQPMDVGCGALHPDVTWSGERALFSWIDNRGLAEGRAVLVDVTDRDGVGTGAGSALYEGSGDLSVPPRFAIGHGAVAMVTGHQPEPRVTRLAFVLYSLDGRERARQEFDAPPSTRWGITDVAASPDGWLVVGTDRTSFDEPTGRPTIRLDADGGLVEGPLLVEPGYEWSVVELEPLPGGGFLLAGLLADPDGGEGVAVMRLDERGRRIDVWRPDPPTYFGLSGFDLVAQDGRVLLIYAGPAEDDAPNEVVLHELGCVE